MAIQPLLRYADLNKAHAFIRDAEDENGETIAADHPEFYCTKVHGVHRAALPHLSDRDFVSFRDAEDELIARIDGATVTEDDEELLDDEELYDEVDQEYHAAWLEQIESAGEDFASGTVHKDASKVVVVRRRVAAKAPEAFIDDELPPAVISPSRALLTGPKTVIRETGSDRHTWKDNTTNGRQFLRHA